MKRSCVVVCLLGLAGCLSLPKASRPLQPEWLIQARPQVVGKGR